MGTWRILSVRGGGHEDAQYQLASGIAARAHLRVRGGHRGVHALRHPHANPEHGGLARRGGAHLRARDGRRVGVHGQLPAHHQQHNDGRLRVQGAALRHRRQERRRHLLGGQQLLHPLHELRAAPGSGQARCLRNRGAGPVQRAKGHSGVLPHCERRPGRGRPRPNFGRQRRRAVPLCAGAQGKRELP